MGGGRYSVCSTRSTRSARSTRSTRSDRSTRSTRATLALYVTCFTHSFCASDEWRESREWRYWQKWPGCCSNRSTRPVPYLFHSFLLPSCSASGAIGTSGARGRVVDTVPIVALALCLTCSTRSCCVARVARTGKCAGGADDFNFPPCAVAMDVRAVYIMQLRTQQPIAIRLNDVANCSIQHYEPPKTIHVTCWDRVKDPAVEK